MAETTGADNAQREPRRVFHAHSLQDRPEHEWQLLIEHLQSVGQMAAAFAQPFGAQHAAELAGLMHDLGKYTEAFQTRIRGEDQRVDHATWGAKIALERYGPLGYLIAYAIAGHHAGLANGMGDGTRTSLQLRLEMELPLLMSAWQSELQLPTELIPPNGMRPKSLDQRNFTAALLVRMLYSCLVDADFLDTEAYYARAEGRVVPRGTSVNLSDLQAALNTFLAGLAERARPSTVNADRQRIQDHVRAQASLPPGLFSLTVPTGGGKTLVSLGFGLDHAITQGLRRLIYVIPFTSIVEQTARVFRDALGPLGEEAVLEHHSAFMENPLQALEGKEKTRLAMENWDSPIVVTTAVQFFESLFADRPSQCRKLHRIAGSVIVLDEAQTMPLKHLRPTLLALDELARNYRCTVVFCTATQPALSDARFGDVIGPMRELAPEPARLFQAFRRVSVRHVGTLDDAQIVDRLTARDQALCIVNNRLHARALHQAVDQIPGSVYLSTLMCARHRSEVLAKVRQSLRDGIPCRVVSTSLIEAGVDVSFPFVMRAEAGLDSIAQAAGRCNREGLWAADTCEVQVFSPDVDQWRPPKELQQFAAVAAGVLRQHAADPLHPDAIRRYFEDLYWAQGTAALDCHDLLGQIRGAQLNSLPFEDLARQYRLIETAQSSVIIPYDREARSAIRQLEFADGARGLARLLQPYSVQVPRSAFEKLRTSSAVQPVCHSRWGDQFMVLVNEGLYDTRSGLYWEDPSFLSSAQLVH